MCSCFFCTGPNVQCYLAATDNPHAIVSSAIPFSGPCRTRYIFLRCDQLLSSNLSFALCVHACTMHLREDVHKAVYEYTKGNNGEGKKELKIRTGYYMPWTDKSEIYQWEHFPGSSVTRSLEDRNSNQRTAHTP